MKPGRQSASSDDWFFTRMDEVVRRTRPHTPDRFVQECDAMSKAAGIDPRDGRTLLALSTDSRQLFVLDAADLAIRHRIALPGAPFQIALGSHVRRNFLL